MRTALQDQRAPRLLRLATLVLTCLVAGSAHAGPNKAFGPAETLAYDIRYLGLPVGKLQLMVGSGTSMNGRTIWPVVALAATDPVFVLYPVRDKYVTWWDPSAQLPIGSELVADENRKYRRERVRYARSSSKAETIREKAGSSPSSSSYSVPADVHDLLSALLALRGHRLEIGDHEEVPVFTGKKLFTLKADVLRREPIEVAAGRFIAKVVSVQVQFSGQLESKREVRVFVTDDERHVPLRVDAEFLFGTLAADLTSYQKGISQ